MFAADAGVRPLARGYPFSPPGQLLHSAQFALRPVSREAPIGEHTAFDWTLLDSRSLLASELMLGVETEEP